MPSSFFTVQQEDTGRAAESLQEREVHDAPIPPGRLHELNARGRTVRSTFHPVLSQGQAWISEKQVNARVQSSFIVLV
jgi:hypothetical protein